jgi:hypothetical protein
MLSASTSQAIEFYHQLLADGHLSSTRELLDLGLEQQHLHFDGRPICDVLRPRFIDAKTHEDVQRGARLVVRALTSIYQHATKDAALRQTLGLTEWEEPLVEIDAGTQVPSLVGRLDGLLDEEGQLKFIEYNPLPGGIVLADRLANLFLDMPIMRAFACRYDFWAPDVRSGLCAALAENGRRMGKQGFSNVALIGLSVDKDQAEVELLLRYLKDRGVRLKEVAPEEEWSLREGKLFASDFQVDLVMFSSPQAAGAFLLENGFEHPLVKAVRTDSACILNGLLRSSLFYSKLTFAALSDPSFAQLVEPEVATALRPYIPWTRIIREGKVQYGNQTVDLVPFISEHQAQLVMKPGRGYGGAGVVLGWKCTSEEWTRAIHRFLEEPGVVQERVAVRKESYPVLREGALAFEQRYSDLNPYVWNDEQANGYLVRVARDALMNLSAGGGSMAPMFIVRER